MHTRVTAEFRVLFKSDVCMGFRKIQKASGFIIYFDFFYQKLYAIYFISISPSSAREVKQECRLRAHAFKIMHGPKRTWMTKRKSRGPETYRYGRHINIKSQTINGQLKQ